MLVPNNDKEEENILLTFLNLTKEGKYAKIEESSLPYSRISEESEEYYEEEEFYYSLR